MNSIDAAKKVLKESEGPMHINEIYEEITRRKLYNFQDENFKPLMSKEIWEKSTANPDSGRALFRMVDDDIYEIVHAGKIPGSGPK